MDNTLDRLKALNSRLDIKLSERENGDDLTQSAPKESPARPAAQQKKKESIPTPSSGLDHESNAKGLIAKMGIDPQGDPIRAHNIFRVAELHEKLNIYEKVADFNNIFIYKAMNISGIGLKEEDFGEIREGKYTQIIAITYEPDKSGKKKAKNISLSYFGKAEKLDEQQKNEIIEFVLRWRYEKAFQNLEHYKDLLERVQPSN